MTHCDEVVRMNVITTLNILLKCYLEICFDRVYYSTYYFLHIVQHDEEYILYNFEHCYLLPPPDCVMGCAVGEHLSIAIFSHPLIA